MKLMRHQFKFVENPNLPARDVCCVAISEEATDAITSLNLAGIETYTISSNSNLPFPVRSHADLQLLHLGNNRIFTSDEHLFIGDFNKNFSKIIISEEFGNKYPNDVKLNCKIIGKNIFLNKKTISNEIIKYADHNNLNIINVNQGYTGCSICAVNESVIITDDKSIFTAAQNFLNDALLISKGSIRLKGYDYGFIGGCTGKLGKNKIAFNGKIESHSDYYKITDFLSSYNMDIIELSDKTLTDIGGILPLIEKI